MDRWRPTYEDDVWRRLREVRHQVTTIGVGVVGQARTEDLVAAIQHLEVLTADLKRTVVNRRR